MHDEGAGLEVGGASEYAHVPLGDFLWRTNLIAASVHPEEDLGPRGLCRLNKSFLYNPATPLLETSPLEMSPVVIGTNGLEYSQQD